MTARDIELWEVNEAFAAAVLQTTRTPGLDPESGNGNGNGGAIALGRPFGAAGAILFGPAIDEREGAGKATALVIMRIGGGQGIATLLARG